MEKQKQDYIDIIGGIVSKTVSLKPELEQQIMPLVTGTISKTDKEMGRNILKQYGITHTLNNTLFPYLTNNFQLVISSFILSCVLILLNYVQYGYFFAKIKRLTLAARKILEEDNPYLINTNKEGDFSKLSLEFVNISRIIKNNLNNTEKEKRYLVDLLQNISHQLKTKLATIILYNDILLNREITKEQRVKFLQENSIQLENMNEMIQSILKLAKLDAKTVAYCKKEHSLNEVVEEVVKSFEPLVKMSGVHLEVSANEKIIVQQDKFWIKEAFSNIIKNCIEHTPQGGSVKVSLESNFAFNKVTITDTGEGIDQSDRANIFERFYKSKVSNKKDSVGIGLSIAKAIIEDHNGYIDVKSEKGIGTTFVITFIK
ncbi:MAG: sensor histidine kinase [Cellulosilyticaceae bacterium]